MHHEPEHIETCSDTENQCMSDQHIEGVHLLYLLFTALKTDKCNNLSNLQIIIDSGASTHMFPHECLLSNRDMSIKGRVALGDNKMKLKIVGAGYTNMPLLGMTLLVPELSFGLISISALDKTGCKTVFAGGKVYVFLSSNELFITGTLHNNLYHLDDKYVEALYNNTECTQYPCSNHIMLVDDDCCVFCNSVIEECSNLVDDVVPSKCTNPEVESVFSCVTEPTEGNPSISLTTSDEHLRVQGSAPNRLLGTTIGLSPLEILHQRWGHLGEHNIKKALRLKMVNGAKFNYDDVKDSTMRICFNCQRGRMKAFSKDDNITNKKYKPFEKIANDYKGPFPIQSIHHNNGFYLASDSESSMVFAFPTASKGESVLLNILNEIKLNIELHGYKLMKFQSDFDTVILSEVIHNWLRENHIKLQVSAPYSHVQNGQIERDIQNVLDKARILMITYDVPKKFWEYAVKTACYLINRSPIARSDKTPLEIGYGEIPDISLLVPFYAPGVFHLTKAERTGTWSDKAMKCRFLGYDEKCKNTYIVVTVPDGKIVSRKDCIFDESLEGELTMEQIIEQLENDYDYDDLEDINEETIDNIKSINSERPPIIEEPDDVYGDNGENKDKYYSEVDKFPYFHENTDKDNDLVAVVARICIYTWLNEFANKVHNAEALPPPPKSIKDALSGPEREFWIKAILLELDNFDSRGIFGIADQEGRAMKTKMILKYSYDNNYKLKYKARLVACGYSQIKGIDYEDTYAPTTSVVLVNILFQIGAMYNLLFAVFDVGAAFLEGKNDFKQYARLPPDLIESSHKKGYRVEVIGNFYGEKQGPKIWNDKLDEILKSIGFVRCPAHNCLYRWVVEEMFIVATQHVDDGLMISNADELYDLFLTEFAKQVKKVTLNKDFMKYVGMDCLFLPNDSKIELSHGLYILERYSEYTKLTRTPMSENVNLRDAEKNIDNSSLLPDTGAFRYIADRARPDILVVAGELATGGDKYPSDLHVKTSERAKHYLNSTESLSLSLGGLGKLRIFGYSDASYITTGNCKSRLGGCVFMGYDCGAVYSFSTNDTIVSSISHSSTEAEIKAIDHLVRMLQHIMDITQFIVGEYSLPIKVFVDNTSAITLIKTLKSTHRVRHINVRVAYLHELLLSGFIELHFVPTGYNVADLLTKALGADKFELLRSILMRGHNGIEPNWDGQVHIALTASMLVEFINGCDDIDDI